MKRDFMEFTGKISIVSLFERNSFFIIEGEDGESRLFDGQNREHGITLDRENDIERHERYDLGMDTNMVFTIRKFDQLIVSYRWKIMRQIPELIRYVVDQARIEEYFDGGQQKAIVWMQKIQPLVNFPITDDVIAEVEKALKDHPNIKSVERNGGWFTFIARFLS